MNNLTEVDDKQRDLIVLYHNLKGCDGNFINEELYGQGQKSWAMQWEKRLCRAWEVLQVGNFALRRHDSRLTLLRGRHQWRSRVSSSNPLLYMWRGWNQMECRWNQKPLQGNHYTAGADISKSSRLNFDSVWLEVWKKTSSFALSFRVSNELL